MQFILTLILYKYAQIHKKNMTSLKAIAEHTISIFNYKYEKDLITDQLTEELE
jgi:hypothetical protein